MAEGKASKCQFPGSLTSSRVRYYVIHSPLEGVDLLIILCIPSRIFIIRSTERTIC